MKVYGSLMNRLDEARPSIHEIEVGTGMTEYLWSDREAYEVTRVIDQKHVYVRRFDHKNVGGDFSNDWELISNPENPEQYLTMRGKYWYWTSIMTLEDLETVEMSGPEERLAMAMSGFDPDVIRAKGKQTKYRRAKVRFGVASYYYDYEF